MGVSGEEMQIPSWVIQCIAVGGIGFIFRVVFGLIEKNETKSDESDRRIELSIKEVRDEIKELILKFTGNDKDIYIQTALMREKSEYLRGLQDGKAFNKEMNK